MRQIGLLKFDHWGSKDDRNQIKIENCQLEVHSIQGDTKKVHRHKFLTSKVLMIAIQNLHYQMPSQCSTY